MAKFPERIKNSARFIETDAFRPEIMDMVLRALEALKSAPGRKEWYTDEQIPLIGKNVMSEKSRREGIEAYEEAVLYYALRALFRRLKSEGPGRMRAQMDIFGSAAGDAEWESARLFCLHAGLDRQGLRESLIQYTGVLDSIQQRTESSRARDEVRGARIFPDYPDVHGPVAADPVVLGVRESTRKEKQGVEEFLSRLS